MRVSLIIPCYIINNELVAETVKCINSLEDDAPDELLLINNGSTVGSTLPFTHSININAGYSGGVNYGLERADGDILVVGNNDLQFVEGWIDETRLKFQEYDALIYRQSDDLDNNKFKSIWAVSREVYEDIGPLDEQFFTAFADTDYWRRVKDAGYRIGLSDVIIGHSGGKTLAAEGDHPEHYGEAVVKYKSKWGDLD